MTGSAVVAGPPTTAFLPGRRQFSRLRSATSAPTTSLQCSRLRSGLNECGSAAGVNTIESFGSPKWSNNGDIAARDELVESRAKVRPMTRAQATRQVIRSQRTGLDQFAQEPIVERVHVCTDWPCSGLIIDSTSSGATWTPIVCNVLPQDGTGRTQDRLQQSDDLVPTGRPIPWRSSSPTIQAGDSQSVAALAHLVQVLADQPEAVPPSAGEVVTTGVITDAHLGAAGGTWSTEIGGLPLPGLRITFE